MCSSSILNGRNARKNARLINTNLKKNTQKPVDITHNVCVVTWSRRTNSHRFVRWKRYVPLNCTTASQVIRLTKKRSAYWEDAPEASGPPKPGTQAKGCTWLSGSQIVAAPAKDTAIAARSAAREIPLMVLACSLSIIQLDTGLDRQNRHPRPPRFLALVAQRKCER
jgi:hypothetical protein